MRQAVPYAIQTNVAPASEGRRPSVAARLRQRSFVPPNLIRALRNLTRYRKAQTGERHARPTGCTRSSRDTAIKSDGVTTDIPRASGRPMLDGLVAGTTDPDVLAELAEGKLRPKIPALKQALVGPFDRQHAVIVSAILAHLDFLDGPDRCCSTSIRRLTLTFRLAAQTTST